MKFLEPASAVAREVDAVFAGVLAVTIFFTVLIFALLLIFSIRYRRGARVNRRMGNFSYLALEITWTVIPLVIALALFGWAAKVFFRISSTPADAMEVYVLGKQWMWKLQHADGAREINELHVPARTRIKLVMTSQDVIHSFFLPAFRIKQDVLPGRYTTLWFEAERAGTYQLFCAEYCGTDHSRMIGRVIVLEPEQFAEWSEANRPHVARGERVFEKFGCASCHRAGEEARGPDLAGLYGREVIQPNGMRAVADANYLRDAILTPARRLPAGQLSLMPAYQTLISEEELFDLIAFIKSNESN